MEKANEEIDITPETEEKFYIALTRDVRYLQMGGGLRSAHAESYKFLGQMTLFGKNYAKDGSVFLVNFNDRKFFITAKHCISDKKEFLDDCETYIHIQGKPLKFKSSDFKFHPHHDLAALETESNLKTDLTLNHVNIRLKVGDRVESYGYPWRCFAYSVGEITCYGSRYIQHSSPIVNGSSGGPLLMRRGRERVLIGMTHCIRTPTEQEAQNYLHDRSFQPIAEAVSAEVIAYFLLGESFQKTSVKTA